MSEEQATQRQHGTASNRVTHPFMVVTVLVTGHIFDCKPDAYEALMSRIYINQIGLMMSCPGRAQVTDRMADKACKRGRLRWAV